MIERIGQWVLEEALRDAARWEQMRPDVPPLRVGVNVSMHQLQNPRFPDSVADAIKAAGIEPQTLALELDESVLRDEAEQMRSTLRLLKRIGVRLAVHDFGTGDSSLRQLAALPIDTIKVERRFVAALGTEDATSPIAEAVIATGSALGLQGHRRRGRESASRSSTCAGSAAPTCRASSSRSPSQPPRSARCSSPAARSSGR